MLTSNTNKLEKAHERQKGDLFDSHHETELARGVTDDSTLDDSEVDIDLPTPQMLNTKSIGKKSLKTQRVGVLHLCNLKEENRKLEDQRLLPCRNFMKEVKGVWISLKP